jgi:N-acylglucosamine 2-epimerase
MDFPRLQQQYITALRADIIPFWEKYSIDGRGGFFTCLDRSGTVYDTDKFVWLQARQTWTFSMLYTRLEKNTRWLEIAKHGFDFLHAHGTDREGNWYYALTRDGTPLVQPYNIFSDCFAAMALSQYALASGNSVAQDLALRTYRNILRRKDSPKGKYSKIVPGTRPVKSYALPMILMNLIQELSWLLDPVEYATTRDALIREVSGFFIDPDTGLVHEHVSPDGSHPDTFDGRSINPGHGIEGMWFLMDLARSTGDDALISRALDSVLRTLDRAWDPEYGGIFYLLDAQGKPPLAMEWDQKLWWVHVETLIALLLGYRLTRRPESLTWFERVHDYTWNRFPDPEFGEWWGYLDRRGDVLIPLKGGKWKGCYHIPRALLLCANLLGELHE